MLAGARNLDELEREYIVENRIDMMTTDTLSDPQTTGIRVKGYRHIYLHIDLVVLGPPAFAHIPSQADGEAQVVELEG